MDREEWLLLEITQKLLKQINLELTALAVNSSKGSYTDPANPFKTQYFNGVCHGNVGAYQRVKQYMNGDIESSNEEPLQ